MFGKSKSKKQTEGVWQRLRNGLKKTRAGLFTDVDDLFKRTLVLDDEVLEEVETLLLMADVGIDASMEIIEGLKNTNLNKVKDEDKSLSGVLRKIMTNMLEPVQQTLDPVTEKRPFVILMVGVNGVGKTTTIGKMAKQFSDQGLKVLLAAGDTFRAAAIEQLQSWGDLNHVPVIAQKHGADSAAVIYDALESSRSRSYDIVIADTAGRLQNKEHLMEELKKIRRTITKYDPDLSVETMLVVDAGTGQNALSQAREFNDSVGLTGMTLTKLDGTAKGGIIFALAKSMKIPIRYIGIGEQADDLHAFNAAQFVEALLTD